MKAVKSIAFFASRAAIGIVALIDLVVARAVQPLAQRFTKSRPIRELRKLSQRLPAYGALCCLVIPFVVAEPAKIYGMFLLGTGHFLWGMFTIILAYFLSLMIADTILEGARPQLRSLVWFALLLDWVSEVRHNVATAVRSSPPYQFIARLLARYSIKSSEPI